MPKVEAYVNVEVPDDQFPDGEMEQGSAIVKRINEGEFSLYGFDVRDD